MNYSDEFKKYAIKHHGINSMYFDKIVGSMTPYIIEERQLNVAQMDVFSRLMMDRIIFLGTAINDSVANIIQAQLLFLESTDKDKDIQIYIIVVRILFHRRSLSQCICALDTFAFCFQTRSVCLSIGWILVHFV